MVNNQVREYNGIYEVLTELKGRGTTLGIVSSKYKKICCPGTTQNKALSFFLMLL